MSSAALPPSEIVAQGSTPRAASAGELVIAAAILFAVNLPLFLGGNTDTLAFHSGAIAAGEWWRLLTHPLAHLSWYHLLLDAASFLLLHAALPPMRLRRRLGLLAAIAAASIAAAVLTSPIIGEQGLRGLSGVDHGLMAFNALTSLRTRETRVGALISLLIVSAKCVCENLTGAPLFGAWHFGLLGPTIVQCHAGGVLGAVAFWLAGGGSHSLLSSRAASRNLPGSHANVPNRTPARRRHRARGDGRGAPRPRHHRAEVFAQV